MFGSVSIYESKERWKIGLIVVLAGIVITSIVYTNYLARKLVEEEKKKIALFATVYKKLNSEDEKQDYGFLFEIIESNTTVPMILTNKHNRLISSRNIGKIDS